MIVSFQNFIFLYKSVSFYVKCDLWCLLVLEFVLFEYVDGPNCSAAASVYRRVQGGLGGEGNAATNCY